MWDGDTNDGLTVHGLVLPPGRLAVGCQTALVLEETETSGLAIFAIQIVVGWLWRRWRWTLTVTEWL